MEGSLHYLYPNMPSGEQERAAIGFLSIFRRVCKPAVPNLSAELPGEAQQGL